MFYSIIGNCRSLAQVSRYISRLITLNRALPISNTKSNKTPERRSCARNFSLSLFLFSEQRNYYMALWIFIKIYIHRARNEFLLEFNQTLKHSGLFNLKIRTAHICAHRVFLLKSRKSCFLTINAGFKHCIHFFTCMIKAVGQVFIGMMINSSRLNERRRLYLARRRRRRKEGGGGQWSIKRRSKNPLATASVVGGLVVSSRRSIC